MCPRSDPIALLVRTLQLRFLRSPITRSIIITVQLYPCFILTSFPQKLSPLHPAIQQSPAGYPDIVPQCHDGSDALIPTNLFHGTCMSNTSLTESRFRNPSMRL
jgi:hypothetical protein